MDEIDTERWLCLELTETITVKVGGIATEELLSFADGMIGALAVFETKEQAEAFAGSRDLIRPITLTLGRPTTLALVGGNQTQ